jgi:hypothetical protein
MEISVVTGSVVTELRAGEPEIIAAGNVIVRITNTQALPWVRLDGCLRALVWVSQNEAILPLDLSRSVGFHHLQVSGGRSYWFGTEDAKLGIEGIEAMMAVLRSEARTWSGQLLFSDGGFYRDPHTIFGFLDQQVERFVITAQQILANPRTGRVESESVTSAPHGPVQIESTIRMLRARPRDLLEVAADGPIQLQQVRYAPRKVVVRAASPTFDTVAHRRLAWCAVVLRQLSEEVAAKVSSPTREVCQCWIASISSVVADPRLQRLAVSTLPHDAAAPSSPDEQTDSRYWDAYSIADSCRRLTEWTLGREMSALHSYVDVADQIYQQFAAYVLAEALDLQPTHPALGLGQPAFESDEFALYYDTVPRPEVVQSWRKRSRVPDGFRPDLLLVRPSTGQVALFDVKYRNSGVGASEDSRRDMMSYLNAFGLKTSFILYPPDPVTYSKVGVLKGEGYRIVEIPVAPTGEVVARVRRAAKLIRTAVEVPPWRA